MSVNHTHDAPNARSTTGHLRGFRELDRAGAIADLELTGELIRFSIPDRWLWDLVLGRRAEAGR